MGCSVGFGLCSFALIFLFVGLTVDCSGWGFGWVLSCDARVGWVVFDFVASFGFLTFGFCDDFGLVLWRHSGFLGVFL